MLRPVIDSDVIDADAIDTETTKRLLELQTLVGPDQDVLGDLARIFDDDSQRYLQELKEALKTQDDEVISRLVHTIKGAALGVGAQHVSSFCLDIERDEAPFSGGQLERLTSLVLLAREALLAQAAEQAKARTNG